MYYYEQLLNLPNLISYVVPTQTHVAHLTTNFISEIL